MKRWGAFLAAFVAMVSLAVVTPARAQDPVGGALATLAAATAQAEQMRAAQRATAQAVSVETTRQVAAARATESALAVEATRTAQQATRSAMEELSRQRAMTATAQALEMEATATRQAQVIEAQATRQVIEAQEREQLARTYAMRQGWFTVGLLAVEVLAIAGAAFVLLRVVIALAAWADHFRPRNESPLPKPVERLESQVVIGVDGSKGQERMPDTVQVVNDPRVVEAIDRWAEQYDKEREA